MPAYILLFFFFSYIIQSVSGASKSYVNSPISVTRRQ